MHYRAFKQNFTSNPTDAPALYTYAHNTSAPTSWALRVIASTEGIIATAGGGGYGAPMQRDPAEVQTDLRNGKISLEAARELYGYRSNA